jgi:protein-L-isoaspartate(D-aspartate) O-methyltransferase
MIETSQELIESMITSEVLQSPRIIQAFEEIDRKYFVPDEYIDRRYADAPLPIGNNQTISQPSTVAFMLELLNPKEGDKILDIGSGSGWATALLCSIVGKSGSVLGLERVDALVEVGRFNLQKFKFGSCHIQKATPELGIPGETYDAILVSASADEIPKELFDQLRIGATLVIPVQHSIFKFKKISQNHIETDEYSGFAFVPLIYEKAP